MGDYNGYKGETWLVDTLCGWAVAGAMQAGKVPCFTFLSPSPSPSPNPTPFPSLYYFSLALAGSVQSLLVLDGGDSLS